MDEANLKVAKDPLWIDEMTKALKAINFFIGGLSNEGIEYYYNKMKKQGFIK